jgi:hypothetical protein
LDRSVDVIVWEDDVEDKDDSDWVENMDNHRWQQYVGPRADHDGAGPEYRYLDWYATTNTDYV